jgi:protein-tyrosine phosphatase
MKVAQTLSQLHEHGITRVVNCAGITCQNYFEHEPGFVYLKLDLYDSSVEDIGWFFCEVREWRLCRMCLTLLLQVVCFVHDAVTENRHVLIHCEKGVSRSCSFAIAYVMWVEGLSFAQAFDWVKMRRTVCSPNSAFICNLLEIEALYSIASRTDKVCVLRQTGYGQTIDGYGSFQLFIVSQSTGCTIHTHQSQKCAAWTQIDDW